MGEALAAELPVSRERSFKKVQRIFLSDDAVCCVCWRGLLLRAGPFFDVIVRFFHKLTLFCFCLSLVQCSSIGMLERFNLMKKGLLQPIDAAHYTHVFHLLEK